MKTEIERPLISTKEKNYLQEVKEEDEDEDGNGNGNGAKELQPDVLSALSIQWSERYKN